MSKKMHSVPKSSCVRSKKIETKGPRNARPRKILSRSGMEPKRNTDSPYVGRVDPSRRRANWLEAAAHPTRDQLVERAEIGFRRGNQRIRIGALRGHGTAVLGETHRHFGLRIGSLGDSVHLVELERRLVRHQRLDAVEHRIDRAIAVTLLDHRLAFDVELHGGALRS